MNYPYPIPGSQTSQVAFTANPSLILGSYTKALDARTQLSVDYSKLIPGFTISNFSFRVKPGGSPQLWIDDIVSDLSGTLLTFYVGAGRGGIAYEVIINVWDTLGGVRSDTLTINVLEGDCDCPSAPYVPPGFGGAVSGDGSIYVNTAPRFFVSGTIPVGGRPLDRWYDTTSGDVYDCITNGILSYWTISIPASGGAVTPISTASIIKLAPIAPDGTTTVFNLTASTGVAVNIVGSNTLFVSVNGVWQNPLTEYAAGSNQITFIQAPEVDAKVFMVWFAAPNDATDGADGANIISISPIIPDGATTTFIMNGSQPISVVGSNALFVSVDGVWQEPGVSYVASGSLITFTEPPSADSKIFMSWFAPPLSSF